MKPAVILFTTISFVMIITVLIMKMLHNNEELLVSSDKDFVDAQALLIVNDLKNIIGKRLFENKSTIEEFVNGQGDSLINNNNMTIKISITKFDRQYNLNDVLKKNKNEKIKNFFLENELNYEDFTSFIENHFISYDIDKINLANNKQVEGILKSFQDYINSNNLSILINNFTYFKINKNDKYYRCNLLINIDKFQYKSSFIYNIEKLEKNNIKVQDFEITIAS